MIKACRNLTAAVSAPHRQLSAFVATRPRLADAAVPATEDEPATAANLQKPKRRDVILRESTEWLEYGGGKQFENASPRNWLHPERPFPKNPWFTPPAPIGDATRRRIYDDYRADPYNWTPRRLALKYSISVLRAEAILRLKHLEQRQAQQGYVLQKKFAAEMERLLDADGVDRVEEDVDLRTTNTAVRRPVFALRSESVQKSDGDNQTAPAVTEEMFKRRPDGNYVMALSGVITDRPSDAVTVLEEKNEREVNPRWQWLIADTSQDVPMEERQMLVRERTGRLRTATGAERRMHLKLYPQQSPEKLLNSTGPVELWEV